MSDIIDTGLGWWANEDWLRDSAGEIGAISTSIGLNVPQAVTIPTAAECIANGILGVVRPAQSIEIYYMANLADITMLGYLDASNNQYCLFISYNSFTLYAGYTDGRPLATYTSSRGASGGITFQFVTLTAAPGYINPDLSKYSSLNAAEAAFVAGGGSSTSFYKMRAGYAVSCFMRWLNANQQELVAPILVSTVSEYTKISLDGQTEAPGIVTGIEFGDMTFYVNILLGYSGDVTASVPYQDITTTFPEGINITELFRAIATFAQIRFSDPYREGGISGPGGGGGTFDFTSTDIPIPPLPTIGAYDTGFISLYKPSDSELRALAAYLWSGPFDLDNFKKIFANPMDCILGLHIIPTAGAHPLGSASALMVGNISTGLSMQRLSEQYYELDCGTITIDPKWGAYLDYSPYSKLSLFLPYIGFVTISPDDCMNGTIRVVYHVDVLSGSCCAYVYCASNQGTDGHTLYTFTGGCACDCPVTEGQYTNGLFGSLRGGIGLAAGLLSASPAGIMGGIEEAANAALSMVKPDVGRSGSFGGSAGLMGIQYPYLVLTIPKMCTPGDQNIYRGYPSFVTAELGNISGYASVEITHMENMSATDDEVSEIMGLLGEGVIF